MTVFFSRLLYTIFILPVSRLPFPALYVLSDGLFFVMYYLVRYRRKVVRGNLERSFPEKNSGEIKGIEKDFYRHFCDLALESFKMFTISERDILERMVFENTEIFDRFLQEGKSVIVAGGHYSNWEMFAVACQLYWKHQGVSLYKPLTNPWFEKVMKKTRGRFGLQMVPIQQAKEFFEQGHTVPVATIFGMDQSPSKVKSSHWMKFLNQDTAVIFGTERYARRFQQPVIFGRILKLSRGHYKTQFELITADPDQLPHAGIVEKAMHLLEEDIRREPHLWLWTHRRWKHKKPAEN